MADPTAVKRALRSLATGDRDRPYRRLIDDAADARRGVEAAARFRDRTGVAALDRAVRRARAADDAEAAARGREALAAFERFRRAARGDDPTGSGGGTEPTDAGEDDRDG